MNSRAQNIFDAIRMVPVSSHTEACVHDQVADDELRKLAIDLAAMDPFDFDRASEIIAAVVPTEYAAQTASIKAAFAYGPECRHCGEQRAVMDIDYFYGESYAYCNDECRTSYAEAAHERSLGDAWAGGFAENH